jgi:hypothetical protein
VVTFYPHRLNPNQSPPQPPQNVPYLGQISCRVAEIESTRQLKIGYQGIVADLIRLALGSVGGIAAMAN